MGHAIGYLEFSIDESRADITHKCDVWAAENCDPWEHGGNAWNCGAGPIDWFDKTLPNRQAAEKWIETKDRQMGGLYNQIAVKFLDYDNAKKPAALISLEERISKAKDKLHSLEYDYYFKERKAKTVGCPKCGSKLAIAYMNSNYCPLCREDLRPETYRKDIARKREKIKELELQLAARREEWESKAKSKAKEKWMVKLEVHC